MFANLASNLGPFFDPVALGIVGGGTLGALALRTPLPLFGRTLAAIRIVARRAYSAEPHLQQIAALSRIARRNGVVALDRTVIADPDIAAAVEAIVDGAPPLHVTEQLEVARFARTERHLAIAEGWSAIADIAPAMGMIGTLIGLATMFRSMTDPAAIGPAMAIALLATLYGAMLAALVASPVAARLKRQARIEAIERERLAAPLAALAERERPRLREVAA